jgi:hypothetical protein
MYLTLHSLSLYLLRETYFCRVLSVYKGVAHGGKAKSRKVILDPSG